MIMDFFSDHNIHRKLLIILKIFSSQLKSNWNVCEEKLSTEKFNKLKKIIDYIKKNEKLFQEQ